MRLQVLKDGHGNDAGVFIPMSDWQDIIQKHEDLKTLVKVEPKPQKKLSNLAGKISRETTEAMQNSVIEDRRAWEERLNKES